MAESGAGIGSNAKMPLCGNGARAAHTLSHDATYSSERLELFTILVVLTPAFWRS
jgi:hypothetical protein